MEKQRTPPLTVPPTRQAFVLCTRAFPEFRVRVSVWCPVPHPTRRPTPPAPAVGLQIDRQSLSRRSARDNKHGVRLIDIGGFRSRTGSTKHAYADQEGGRSTQTPHHKKCPFSPRFFRPLALLRLQPGPHIKSPRSPACNPTASPNSLPSLNAPRSVPPAWDFAG